MAALESIASWPAPRYAVAAGVGLAAALAIGIPTDLVDTPLFGRQIAPAAWAYLVWIVASALGGLLVAASAQAGRFAAGGGLLALVAVGCPVCNKLVLLALGSSGALQWFAPLQPALGALSIVLLAAALAARQRARARCAGPLDALRSSRDGPQSASGAQGGLC